MKPKSLIRIFTALIFAALLWGCDHIADPDHVSDPTPASDYRLIWSDEFDQDSTAPLASKWNYELGYGSNNDGWGNDEWQNYTNSSENVRVEDGKLVITAVWDSTHYQVPGKRNGSVTSARINTKDKFSVKYGKVQARIKLPKGSGMWPAFWMLGDNYTQVGWPQCGEMDIMEMSPLYYDDKTTICTLHWWDETTSTHTTAQGLRAFEQSLADDYHVYELEWDDQRVIGRIDNMTYMIKTIDSQTMSEFLNNYFLILNVAVGGNFGGAPDETTMWPQSMFVDWVRVYQKENNQGPVHTYGIFTDNTAVDAGLTVGLNAQIYVWENTLAQGTIVPYEGDNGMAWVTTGVGWFGAGIQADQPTDLSGFTDGNLEFMIKIPAEVAFSIGVNDTQGHEHYVDFPANQTAWGLERNGNWGRASIPVQDLAAGVNLDQLSYVFMIKEEHGAQCQFAIDDIYMDGGGAVASSVAFDANSYTTDDTQAVVTVTDEGAPSATVNTTVDNGSQSIQVAVTLDAAGSGSATVHFGTTDDTTDTIAITAGQTLTANYTNTAGRLRTATAGITAGLPSVATFGVFTDTTPVTAGVTVGVDAQIYVWENTLTAGTTAPYEGDNVIAWQTTGMTWFGAGVMADNAVDLSSYAGGTIQFMIKMPANVTFKIGVLDAAGHENYVTFPANQTAYGLERNGEWGRAVIPVNSLITTASLSSMRYVFTILEQNGTQCAFGIDDIYWRAADGSRSIKLSSGRSADRNRKDEI